MGPATAGAHSRSGRSAVDYRASVSTTPPGVTARVHASDLALGLTVAAGHRAVVLGYVGEPAIRVGAGGVDVNEFSPTAAGIGLLKQRPKRVTGTQKWRRISSGHKVTWHDARLRGLPPRLAYRRWTVPLVVDGQRAALRGELVRVPRPSRFPWLALAALTGVSVALVLRRRSLLRTATLVFGLIAATASVVSAADFALASTAIRGAWVEGANELVFALVGMAFVLRGSPNARALASGALGLLALFVGLSKLPALLHGVVLSALPADASRTAVAVSICAGAAALVLGLVIFVDVLTHYEESGGGAFPKGRSSSG